MLGGPSGCHRGWVQQSAWAGSNLDSKEGGSMEETQELIWDCGTAYDLFVSLEVLHEPAEFGVRASWAAGVRARLPGAEREILEQGRMLFHIPFHWLYSLPEPKEGTTVLWALGQVPPAERLPLLAFQPDVPTDLETMLCNVAACGTWSADDEAALCAAYSCGMSKKAPSAEDVASILGWWANAAEFGERYLEALSAYRDVFFAEEETRIQPALEAALARAQQLAEQLTLPDLLEELSQGVRLEELPASQDVVLAPSYWCTPLIFFGKPSTDLRLFLFGARPPDASLVPGEAVPDAMLAALKALSDPTRLRILRYLAEEPLTPAQLARRLRLRAPTVTHHLKALRLAGLLQVRMDKEKSERRYAARSEAIAATFDSLAGFLRKEDNPN
jgi:DNA-binding transcriptional ArsR family regulator